MKKIKDFHNKIFYPVSRLELNSIDYNLYIIIKLNENTNYHIYDHHEYMEWLRKGKNEKTRPECCPWNVNDITGHIEQGKWKVIN